MLRIQCCSVDVVFTGESCADAWIEKEVRNDLELKPTSELCSRFKNKRKKCLFVI